MPGMPRLSCSSPPLLTALFPSQQRRVYGRQNQPIARSCRRAHGGLTVRWRSAHGPLAVGPWSARSLRLLDLDLDVDARGQLETLERVHRLGRRLEDVEQALVDA